MEKLVSAFKSIHFVEIVLMLSVFVSVLVRFVFSYQATFFMEIFSIGLALVYFPFGFYFIKKPSENYTKTMPVILGLVYGLGVLAILISAANVDSYRYPLLLDFSIPIALIIYLLFKLRSADYPDTFINTQFIRIAFLVVTGFVILIK